ncbi:hypothetical protein TGRUB_434090 [Toxoplasma gondii RUB]|uniref:Uncharacterized protein n=1 Tax=Toxoplasma gondii RUB TaxID=935652 RepID=A0A086LIZ7_TOXGO|nr:hypothetical protein TGRUB_434090 [Toxoplasma gondii RUB]
MSSAFTPWQQLYRKDYKREGLSGVGCVGQSSCGSERPEFTRFGIRRLWRVAAPHGPAFFPYESRRVPARMGER